MVRSFALATLLLSASSLAFSQTQPSSQCTFTPEHLAAVLGKSFRAGIPEAGFLGKGCTYAAGDVKLWVDAGPNPAPSAQLWRKMASGPGTTWIPVPNDPDKAVHSVAPKGISPFPSMSYERNGWIVNMTVTGVGGKAEIDAWNAKLLKLKRFP
jgi:hypothetical protein